MWDRKALRTLSAVFCLFALFFSVFCKADEDDESVLTRTRPAFDPLGIRVRDFILLPVLEVGIQYSDNIFTTASSRSDRIQIVSPKVNVQSKWDNHAFGFIARFEDRQYSVFTKENHQDYELGMQGRLDLTRRINIGAEVAHNQINEPRGSHEDNGDLFPTQYEISTSNFSFSRKWTEFSIDLHQELKKINNTGAIDHRDFDRRENKFTARFANSLGSGETHFLYLQSTLHQRNYDRNMDRFGFSRGSLAMEILVGASSKASGASQWDLFAGYQIQDHQDQAFLDIADPTFGAEMIWRLSGLTSVIAVLTRDLEATNFDQASGILASRFTMSAHHELLRNLLIHINFGFGLENYQSIHRTDEVFTFQIGGQYMLNRNIYLIFGYNHREHKLSPMFVGSEFTIDNFSFSVHTQI